MATSTTDNVWREQDTTPTAIEAAIRQLEHDRVQEHPGYVQSRVLNLVLVVDKDWSGEIANRLRRLGRFQPSRTIVCSIGSGRTTLDALVTVAAPGELREHEIVPTRETVVVEMGQRHVPGIDTIVDPLVKTDIPTLVWAPHGHHDAVEQLLELSQIVLVDSVEEPDPGEAIRRALALTEKTYVVDLAWLRSTPWRERIAGTFDPLNRRRDLGALTRLEIRHHPDSLASGLLLAGWLASRLGWEPSALVRHDGGWRAKLHARRQDVTLDLVTDRAQSVPGLAGMTIETARGETRTLDRGPGGLHATLTRKDGSTQSWTVLGASRGESGILGEGVRQALLRDRTYLPALRVAEALVR
ncbi:glucose-6-phosphate dehydrogenase assembly protein OpcA [Paraconexibacter algicola]|uniref:Glucose-6-phosphate dehydrogenase n=1 Tax=Paraconexibacter algicola TaxID=2133960 RepID=A0A2T4UMJ5_9ACTN|nr:glucose-6-phosphate dehydrogenase assembly protein OpcA [Paraconexibacter algicola]PTL60453.1 hypothetical protein C7Y72_12795 [Paraconexibacter algicola]